MQSLRGQIAVGVSVMLVVLWLLAVLGSAFVIKEEIDESFDAALQETGERILPLAVVELIGSDDAAGAKRILPIAQHDEKITYDIRDAQGHQHRQHGFAQGMLAVGEGFGHLNGVFA